MNFPKFSANAVLDSLGLERRVFHSEADFQFAFAWQTKLLYPHVEIRLETHPQEDPSLRLDLQIIDMKHEETIAVELKYFTRAWHGLDGEEVFALKNHRALDVRRYDVVKDVCRVEGFIRGRHGWRGVAVALTNDSGYWAVPKKELRALDAAFRIHDGSSLSGSRAWAAITGSSKGRTKVLTLMGHYPLRWSDYSKLDETRAGTFRSLVVPIEQDLES